MKAVVSRIQSAFERLARERRKALIPYVTAGDPEAKVTVPLMRALVAAGADGLEPGVALFPPHAHRARIPRSIVKSPRNHNWSVDLRTLTFPFPDRDVS